HGIKPKEEIIAIVLDGVGLGDDKNAWGGEILMTTYTDYARIAHLEYHPMPGGDRCVYYPVRMLASMLNSFLTPNEIEDLISQKYLQGLPHGKPELKVLISQLEDPSRLVKTSGMGRVLDAISALLGTCFERTYEGEPAIRLEHLAWHGDPDKFNFDIPVKNGKTSIILTSNLIQQCLEKLDNSCKKADIAASALKSLSRTIANVAIEATSSKGINKIGLSGGCAVNRIIVKTIKKVVEMNGFTFLQHEKTPPGDAGVSVGQAIHGAAYVSHF
ncbi:MAG: Kae1-like domain-containing protein, partial [Candidatus Helarchaeales archaeon]